MEKINKLTSENIVNQNIERLKEIFPTAFAEGKLVVEELQALVGEYIEENKEFYQMTWAGKTEAKKEANKVSTGTLRPNRTDSKDWDTTGNIFIEGDNLEVLKLLQKSYSNKIKMIYIDPPYNTGKDFVYKDNYKDNLHHYLELTGQTDEEGRKLTTNTDSDGRYHSNWLNMMYPRLKLARNLMTDDGVIFISIDDNEQANLKKLCDEIFGEENFVQNYIWESTFRPDNSSKIFRKNAEFIICYAKDLKNIFQLIGHKSGSDGIPSLTKNSMKESILQFPENSVSTYMKDGVYYKGVKKSGYELLDDVEFINGKNINSFRLKGRMIWGQSYLESELEKSTEIIIKSEGFVPYTKKSEISKLAPNSLIPNDLVDDVLGGRAEVKNIFNNNIFEYPKPISLLKYLLSYLDNNDFYTLDFFSGSGTTAHAVMALNAEDGGNRKCISVQLPEPTDEKSEAYKAGFKNIAEITKERIRRAGELIKQENKDKEGIDTLDVGFRAFKLDSSNIRAWDTAVEKLEGQLDVFAENNGDSIKSDRTEEDVLFEILLKYGLDLTLPIQEKTVDGCTIYNIGFGAMYICLSNDIKVSVAMAIGEWHKESADDKPSVIFKDAGFNGNDAVKTNTVQTLRQAGIENVKSI